MPAYSFKSQFVEPIKKGDKEYTIRGKRKHQAKPGDKLYLYYAMRTKFCTKIGEAICHNVNDIEISKQGQVWINGYKLSIERRELLARGDGFANFQEMIAFWIDTNSLPFIGDIIYWKDFKGAAEL